MPIYVVTYDLKKAESEDYQDLWDALNPSKGGLNAHKAAKSFYLVSTTKSTSGLFKHLKQHIDEDDRLIITKCDVKYIQYQRALNGTTKWIEENGGV